MAKQEMLQMSDEEVLKHITVYEAPPEDFDPTTATDHLLRKHGVPRKPHPENEKHLRELWEKAMATKPKFIKAEVAVDHVMSKRKHPVIEAKPEEGGDFSPSGWGGIVVPVSKLGFNPPEPVLSVYGEFQIPSITIASNEPASGQTVGFWVGIDGFGNNQVLQAGTAATVAGKNVTNWVWTEWYPLPPIQVTNFPIKAGDHITVLVCATQPNHGFCSMLNRTTNVTTSIGINNPSGVTSIGATAEWIVEGVSSFLPHFSPVVFTAVSAGTKDHAFNLAKATIITEIKGAGNANLTKSTVLSPTSCEIQWLKSS